MRPVSILWLLKEQEKQSKNQIQKMSEESDQTIKKCIFNWTFYSFQIIF